MKTQTTTMLTLMLAIAAFTGCSNEDAPPPVTGETHVAYISIEVKTPSIPKTRASGEGEALNSEDAIKKLYAVAFDSNNNTTTYSSDPVAKALTGFDNTGENTEQSPDAFRVPASAKKLLLIANPGPILEKVLTDAVKGIPLGAINMAISASSPYVDEIAGSTTGFTMINCGTMVDSDTDSQDNAALCLVDIAGKIVAISDEFPNERLAQEKAKENPVTIHMERITAKVIVYSDIEDGAPSTNVKPENEAIFTFKKWTLDAVNSTFYPWAKKVKLSSVPVPLSIEGFYLNNFYTIDANYDNNTGIVYNKVVDYAPDAPLYDKENAAYCLENTMRAAEQKYMNATRVVIQGTYYPYQNWSGDWFSYGGEAYKDLDVLQEKYKDPYNVNLIDACDRFWVAIRDYANTSGADLKGAISFATLTTEVLASSNIPNGGEVVKDLDNPGIRWFQDGLCYYWYEIRHDDSVTDDMAFGKYGVVRNNVYQLTLNSVSKAGTPWYPNVDPEGGEKDPDPKDPIDETEGYVGVTVQIAPWVKWSHKIDV